MVRSNESLPIKCKLKLVQPYIKCSGRTNVNCIYRGKIVGSGDGFHLIEFKYKGVLIRENYYLDGTGFENKELADIVLDLDSIK